MESLPPKPPVPSTRRVHLIEDRENFERNRLQKRTGGFYQYVDSAEIFRPDPVSTHFINEKERFQKDFVKADQVARAVTLDKQQTKIHNLRKERLEREKQRFDKMDAYNKFQEDRITVKRDVYQAGKKNKGGASFNIINMDYEHNKEGDRLRQIDNDCMVRALMRSKVLDQKNNGGYNILTGEARPKVNIPVHERYNPITGQPAPSAGSNRMRSVGSQIVRSHASLSRRSENPIC